MALKTPTPASPARILNLIWLALRFPAQFEAEEEADSATLNSQATDDRSRVRQIRRALAESFLWCLSSVLLGLALGLIASKFLGTNVRIATVAIIAGTCILLWATLALRGWEIQSYSGATLGERLNRWVFRALYAVGTSLIVAGSFWSLTPA